MDEEQLKYLFDKYGTKGGFPSFDAFKSLMSDGESRKVFFDRRNAEMKFPDFNEFERILGVRQQQQVAAGNLPASTPTDPTIQVANQAMPGMQQIPGQELLKLTKDYVKSLDQSGQPGSQSIPSQMGANSSAPGFIPSLPSAPVVSNQKTSYDYSNELNSLGYKPEKIAALLGDLPDNTPDYTVNELLSLTDPIDIKRKKAATIWQANVNDYIERIEDPVKKQQASELFATALQKYENAPSYEDAINGIRAYALPLINSYEGSADISEMRNALRIDAEYGIAKSMLKDPKSFTKYQGIGLNPLQGLALDVTLLFDPKGEEIKRQITDKYTDPDAIAMQQVKLAQLENEGLRILGNEVGRMLGKLSKGVIQSNDFYEQNKGRIDALVTTIKSDDSVPEQIKASAEAYKKEYDAIVSGTSDGAFTSPYDFAVLKEKIDNKTISGAEVKDYNKRVIQIKELNSKYADIFGQFNSVIDQRNEAVREYGSLVDKLDKMSEGSEDYKQLQSWMNYINDQRNTLIDRYPAYGSDYVHQLIQEQTGAYTGTMDRAYMTFVDNAGVEATQLVKKVVNNFMGIWMGDKYVREVEMSDARKRMVDDLTFNYQTGSQMMFDERTMVPVMEKKYQQRIDEVKARGYSKREEQAALYPIIDEAVRNGGVQYVYNPNKGKYNFTAASIGNAVATVVPQFLGQMAQTAYLGGFGNIGKVRRMATLGASVFANTFPRAYDNAVQMGISHPGQYATAQSLVEVASESMFDNIKMIKSVVPQIRQMFSGLSNGEWKMIVSGVAKKNFSGEAAKVLMDYGKESVIEEGAANIMGNVSDKYVFNIDKKWNEGLKQTLSTSVVGMLPLAAIGIPLRMRSANIVNKMNIYEAAARSEQVISDINSQVSEGRMSFDEAQKHIKAIKLMSDVIHTMPTTNAIGKPLTDGQKAKYAWNEYVIRLAKIDESNAPTTVVREIADRVNEADKENADILNDDDIKTFTELSLQGENPVAAQSQPVIEFLHKTIVDNVADLDINDEDAGLIADMVKRGESMMDIVDEAKYLYQEDPQRAYKILGPRIYDAIRLNMVESIRGKKDAVAQPGQEDKGQGAAGTFVQMPASEDEIPGLVVTVKRPKPSAPVETQKPFVSLPQENTQELTTKGNIAIIPPTQNDGKGQEEGRQENVLTQDNQASNQQGQGSKPAPAISVQMPGMTPETNVVTIAGRQEPATGAQPAATAPSQQEAGQVKEDAARLGKADFVNKFNNDLSIYPKLSTDEGRDKKLTAMMNRLIAAKNEGLLSFDEFNSLYDRILEKRVALSAKNPKFKAETNKAMKEAEKMAQMDSESPVTSPKPKIVSDAAENDKLTEKLTEEDNTEQEPSVAAVEGKAESDSKAELNAAVRQADELINAATDVQVVPLSSLHTDEKRFQNRTKLVQETLNNIINKWNDATQDPIHVWRDPKDGKLYVLSGHHRYYGAKGANRKTVKIIDRTNDFTEEQAIEFAKDEANSNRNMDTLLDKAKRLRELIKGRATKEKINDYLSTEGKNKTFIQNLASLNPAGKTIGNLLKFEDAPDRQTQKENEQRADWIGEARRTINGLTDTHEDELFNFLYDKNASKRITTKNDFLQKVRSVVNPMLPDQPLNIARFKFKTQGEAAYDEEVANKKAEILDRQDQINALNDRFNNPQNPNYISTESRDYESARRIADEKIAKLDAERKALQKQLEDIYRNKGKFTGAPTTGSLFDVFEPTPTYSESAQKLADGFRSLKSGGDKLLGGLGIFVGIWDGMMETIATLIEAGGSLADAITAGVEYARANMQGEKYTDKEIEASLRQVLIDNGIMAAPTRRRQMADNIKAANNDFKGEGGKRSFTPGERMSFREMFSKINFAQRKTAGIIEDILQEAKKYFRENGIDLTKGRVAKLINQLSHLATMPNVDAWVADALDIAEAIDNIIIEQKNANDIKAYNETLKKFQKFRRKSKTLNASYQALLATIDLLSPTKIIRAGMTNQANPGFPNIDTVRNIRDMLELVMQEYGTKQGVRKMDQVLMENLAKFIGDIKAEIARDESERDMAKYQASVSAGSFTGTYDEWVEYQQDLRDAKELNAKQAKSAKNDVPLDKLKALIDIQRERLIDYLKDLDAMYAGDPGNPDYKNKRNIARTLLTLDTSIMKAEDINDLNILLNNIVLDGNIMGAGRFIAYHTALNKRLSLKNNPIRIRYAKYKKAKTIGALFAGLTYSENDAAKFREKIWLDFQQKVNKVQRIFHDKNGVQEQVQKIIAKFRDPQMSNIRVGVFQFLNQSTESPESKPGAGDAISAETDFRSRLNNMVQGAVQRLFKEGKDNESAGKRSHYMMDEALRTLEALQSMGLVSQWKIDNTAGKQVLLDQLNRGVISREQYNERLANLKLYIEDVQFTDKVVNMTDASQMLDDLKRQLVQTELELYNYIADKFSNPEHLAQMRHVSESLYGIPFDGRKNYAPQIPISFKSSNLTGAAQIEEIGNGNFGGGGGRHKVSSRPSDRFQMRTRLADPNNFYYSMDATNNFMSAYFESNMAVEAGMTLKTLSYLINSNEFRDFINGVYNESIYGFEDRFEVIKNKSRGEASQYDQVLSRLADVIRDRVQAPYLYKDFRGFGIRLLQWGMSGMTKTILNNTTQIVKQIVPNLGAGMLVSGPKSTAAAIRVFTEAMFDRAKHDALMEFMNNFEADFRSTMGEEYLDKMNKMFSEYEKSYEFLLKASEIKDKYTPARIGEWAMKKSDRAAYMINALTAYIDYEVNQGNLKTPGDFDITKVGAADRLSVAHALNITEMLNNSSVAAERAPYTRVQQIDADINDQIFKNLMFLKGFSLNAAMQFQNNWSIFITKEGKISNDERMDAAKKAMSYFTQILIFNASKVALGYYLMDPVGRMLTELIFGIAPQEDSDEEKKKKAQKVRTKFIMNAIADAFVGWMPTPIEGLAKVAGNEAYNVYANIAAGGEEQRKKDSKTTLKGTALETRYKPYYIGSSANLGAADLYFGLFDTFVEAFKERSNKEMTPEANAALDQMDKVKLATWMLGQGDLLNMEYAMERAIRDAGTKSNNKPEIRRASPRMRRAVNALSGRARGL